ncbi:hypothetical protein EWM64_g10258 [Hericium alpestre]|uniref:Uncharacterized protein n=1 Tax=Hericium alpestre TaxID=135208 RepID=A0A4Y9ZG96_9AGAM|nr:hypothetical protein EWM64_g10258 [Hericium alpestre]
MLSHSRLSLHECSTVQQAIDAEIEGIPPESSSESVRMLHARRNAYAMINVWLPPELMAAIFYEIVVDFRWMLHLKQHFQTYGFGQQYIAISHVCRVWRTIAISTPRLWAEISLVNADVTAVMLHRSKASPISIFYHSKLDQPISTVPLALAHADRAFKIDLLLLSERVQDLISKYLTKPMPFLKRLGLFAEFLSTARPACFLPPGCLEGANDLGHLDLLRVGLSPGSILPATLTVLALMYPPERLTVSEMIRLLEPLENLCDLCIIDALLSDAPDPTKPSALRRLSPRTHLVRLHLSAPVRERDDFMSRSPIMPKTPVSLSCDAETLDDLHFGQVLKPVHGARHRLRALSLSFLLGRACIKGYSSASFPMMHSHICFSVSVRLHSVFPWHETLRDLCATMPLDSVETLFVESTHDLGESIAPLLGAHLRGVRTLRLMNEAVKYVLRDMHPQAEGISPAFPHLKALAVCYQRYDSSAGYDSNAIDLHLLGPVADCLIARKGPGMTAVVEELEINGEVVPSKYLEYLEGFKSWKHPSSVHGTA